MATLTQTSSASSTVATVATVATAATAAKDGPSDCCVCAEVVSIKDQSVRSCGHMMCNGCDASWRSRGTFIRQEYVTNQGDKFAAFESYSLCPLCRAPEPANAYMNRSKESLIHEIQMLAATVHTKCGGRVDPYTAIDISSMGNKLAPTRATPLEMLYGVIGWQTYAENPYLPLLSAPVPRPPSTPAPENPYLPLLGAAPVPRPPFVTPAPVRRVPGPVVAGPVVTPALRVQPGMEGRYVTADTCIRRFKRLGCTTVRTKLRCPSCHYNLCYSCRVQCPCSN